MTTKQGLVDGVVTLLGDPKYTLGDGSPNDVRIAAIYDEVLADLLRSHPWNFATKRVELSQNATAPVFEYEYAYDLPDDFLRLISVHPSADATRAISYKEELGGASSDTRVLISASNELWLRYVYSLTDTALMPPDFIRAFQYALARDLAIPVAESNTMQDNFAKLSERWLAKARSADGMGATPERRPRGSWAEVRGRALPVVGSS